MSNKIVSPGKRGSSTAIPAAARLGASAVRFLSRRPLSASKRRATYLQLSRTIQAGIPIGSGLERLASLSSGRARRDLHAMAAVLGSGGTLEKAAESAPGLFPAPGPALLAAAERTGTVVETLAALTRAADLKCQVIRKVSKAFAYPVILILSAAFVLPLPRLFTCGSGGYLLAAVSTLMPFLVGGMVLVAIRLALLNERINMVAKRVVGSIPVAGGVYRLKVLADTLGTLGHALSAGLGVSESLRLAAVASGDPETAALCARTDRDIREGGAFASSFCLDSKLPDEVAVAISTGERTGLLADALNESAETVHAMYADRLWWLVRIATAMLLAAVLMYAAASVIASFSQLIGTGTGGMDESIMKEIPGVFNRL